MLWLHGGGFDSGTSELDPGMQLAKKDVVVVSVNHRLNILGFLVLSAVSDSIPILIGTTFNELQRLHYQRSLTLDEAKKELEPTRHHQPPLLQTARRLPRQSEIIGICDK